MKRWLGRSATLAILATTTSCVLGVIGGAAGGGVGYAVASNNAGVDNKAVGATVGAFVGFALGGLAHAMLCSTLGFGAYTMSRSSSSTSDTPWYCRVP